MKSVIAILVLSMVPNFSFAKGEVINWKVCDADIKKFCTEPKDDQAKHTCLEDAPKGKVSKKCADHNAKVGKTLHKHDDKHDHEEGDGHKH